MLKFELKKMWRKKTVLWIMLFAVGIAVVVNHRVSHQSTLFEYPAVTLDGNPFLAVATQMGTKYERYSFDDSYDRWEREQGREADRIGEERRKAWKLFWKERRESSELKQSFPTTDNLYRGYPENLNEYERKQGILWYSLQDFIQKYDIELTEEQRENLDWILFEGEYVRQHGIHSGFEAQHTFVSNAGRRTVSLLKGLWGLPACICFVLLFLGIFSDESRDGTLEFLHTQPMSKRSVLLAKFGVLLAFGILYLMASVLVTGILFLAAGLPMDGFREIFRVFSEKDPLQYIEIWRLILLSAFGFLSVVVFLSAWILFLSSRGGNYLRNLMGIGLLGGMLYILTQQLPAFRQPWNPIYILDYIQVIAGKNEYQTLENGLVVMKTIPAVGMKPYFFFALSSALPMMLSFLTHSSVKHRSKKVRHRNPVSSVGFFEYRKIVSENGFLSFLCGGLGLLVLLFVFLVLEDDAYVKNEIGEGGLVQLYQENLERAEQTLLHVQTHPPGGGEGHWTADQALEYEHFVKNQEENIKVAKEQLRSYENRIRAFQKGNGALFYDSVLQETEEMLGGETVNVFAVGLKTKTESFSRYTYEETSAVLKKAREKNIQPIVNASVLPSERDEFVDPVYKKSSDKVFIPKSHSSFFGLYRMIRLQRLDVILLAVLTLIVFGGYTYDKEAGHQLELLYTEPMRRQKYHWTKIEVSVLLSAGIVGAVCLFLILLGGFTEGIGAWKFPIVYYNSGGFRLIELWQYLLRVFLVLVAECFFLSSLSTFLSIFTKKKNQLLAGLALLVGCGVFLSGYLPQGILRLLSPFQYLQASTVANGSVKIFRNLPKENFWQSVLILIVWGIILGVVGARVVKKRECV